jgi:hypothetical protein
MYVRRMQEYSHMKGARDSPREQSCLGLRRVRTMRGHRGRVGAQAWSGSLLASGSRDRTILQRDARAPQDYQHKLTGHLSEVGLLHGSNAINALQRLLSDMMKMACRSPLLGEVCAVCMLRCVG